MTNKNQEKRIISLAGLGICFAALYWGDGINDFVYDRYRNMNNIMIICSIITFFCSNIFSVANLIIMYIPRSKITKIFNNLLLVCALLCIAVGLSIQIDNIFIFMIFYCLFDLSFEVVSVLHYGYESVTTSDNRLIAVENRRKMGFYVVKSGFILVSNFLLVTFGKTGFLVLCIISALVFVVTYIIQRPVTYINIKTDMPERQSIWKKFELRKYSKKFKLFIFASAMIQFSVTNLVIIFSYHLMDTGMDFSLLKQVKSFTVLIAFVAYFTIEFLNKHQKVLMGYFLSLLGVLILSLFNFSNIVLLAILFGIISFQGMLSCPARYALLSNDTFSEESIQKDAILNLISNVGRIASSLLLLIPFNIAVIAVNLCLSIAIICLFYIDKTRY